MKRQICTWSFTVVAMLAFLAAGISLSWADDHDDEEIPFDEAEVFFELNHTDGDLGIHANIDGEPWKTLKLETPDERTNLRIRLSGRLRMQGLTQLMFESAEPTFDELAPRRFFRRFPEGEYEVEGTTIEGEEMESTSMVTHLMPAPADGFSVNGMDLPEDCDEGPVPQVSEPFTIRWDPVTESHPEIGRTGEPIEVVQYQLVVEREDPDLVFSIELTPNVTEVVIPGGLASPGDEFKVEVLVREASGNQTAVESCFEVD